LVAVSILVLELDFFALNSVCCPFSHWRLSQLPRQHLHHRRVL
jgi:hypothetical protein